MRTLRDFYMLQLCCIYEGNFKQEGYFFLTQHQTFISYCPDYDWFHLRNVTSMALNEV